MTEVRVVCNGCGVLAILEHDAQVKPAWVKDNLSDDDVAYLSCPMYPPPNPVPGYKLGKCEDCGVVICIAPSSQWLLDLR